MKLSAAVRRCRKELPEAPGWPPLLPTAYRRQAKHITVYPVTSTEGANALRAFLPIDKYTPDALW